MKERPILFSAPMVRAILDGTKTQTRRVAKRTANGHIKETGGHRRWHIADFDAYLACPYGQPGDRLWVRETWAYHVQAMGSATDQDGPWVYAADGNFALQSRLCDRWRPSIHMPRVASRITLEITGVRVERLWEVSETDAVSEGVGSITVSDGGESRWVNYSRPDSKGSAFGDARSSYRSLWEEINGQGSWDANPWVWVVEFKRLEAV